MRLKLWTLAAAAFVAVVGITVSIGFLTLEEWLEPWVPAVYLGGALLAVYAVVSAIWFRITRSELQRGVGGGGESAEERGFKRLVGLIVMMLFGVVAIFLSALWNFDLVRGWSLTHLTEHKPLNLTRALGDQSTKVRRIACQHLFDAGLYPYESRLIAALDADPAAALACLTDAAEKDHSGYRVIAGKLVSGWQTAIMQADDRSTDSACRLSQYMPEVARLTTLDSGEAIVFQCALGAPNGVVRECCAETLAARGKMLDHFENPESIPDAEALASFAPMVRHAFGLTEDEATRSIAAKLGMERDESRRFVVELGCGLFDRGFKREVIRGFYPVMESETCGLNEEIQLFFSEVEPWPVLCERVLDGEGQTDVGENFCAVIRDTVTDAAILRASNILDAATRAMYLQAAANTVTSNMGFVQNAMRREDPMDFSNIEIIRFYEKKDTEHILGRTVPRKCYRIRNDMMAAHRMGGLDPDDIKYDIDPGGCTPAGIDRTRTLEDHVREGFGNITGVAKDRESVRLKKEIEAKYGRAAVERGRAKVREKMKEAAQRR